MIGAIVQARMGSTRLQGKSLADVCGKPLLQRVLERLAHSRYVERVVVATTDQPEDDAIEQLARRLNVEVYRGDVADVLDRFYQAARRFDIAVIVRITADDPFKDPVVLDEIVRHYLEAEGAFDYVSNTIEPSYPEGLDVEVFSWAALERAWREASKPVEREHVTPYIWMQPERFRLRNVRLPHDLSHLRWTVDNEKDLAFARAVYSAFGGERLFLMEDILRLLQESAELRAMNAGPVRHERFWQEWKGSAGATT